MRLKDKVAIISGAARGIGAATAKLFASEGAKVFIWDVLEKEAGETANAINDAGGQAWFQKVDTTDVPMIEAAVADIHGRFGKIDILINNAGILRDKSFLKMTYEQWDQVIAVNLTGVFNCTKVVAPIMVENKYGRILSTSSIVGMTGNYGQTNYVAAKAAIIGMTKTWAKELGKHGITANAIAPGYIITDMTAQIPPEMLKGVIGQIPVGRAGQPEDMAHGFLYMASEEAGFLSGQTITINGGVY